MRRHAVIVGSGPAAIACGERLRQLGFHGRITVIAREPHLPYDRPPLSKLETLSAADGPPRVDLRPATWYARHGVDLRLQTAAIGVDVERQVVRLEDGGEERYDDLVIATGARARTLPGTEGIGGVHLLRSFDDALALRASLASARRVVVVGAGFVGMEVAATARSMALDVTVVEAASQPWLAAVGEQIGARLASIHEAEGTDVRTGMGVARIHPNGGVKRIDLADGSAIESDVIVVGIGAAAETQWLYGSGLELGGDLMCDSSLNAGHPAVWGAGDVVSWVSERAGGARMRVEHWTNAVQQGRHAAANILLGHAHRRPFLGLPYFWSQQYGLLIQFIGSAEADRVELLVDDAESVVAAYLCDERVVGCFTINAGSSCMLSKQMIEQGGTLDDLRRRLSYDCDAAAAGPVRRALGPRVASSSLLHRRWRNHA